MPSSVRASDHGNQAVLGSRGADSVLAINLMSLPWISDAPAAIVVAGSAADRACTSCGRGSRVAQRDVCFDRCAANIELRIAKARGPKPDSSVPAEPQPFPRQG